MRRIRLLGALRLEDPTGPIPLTGSKGQSLFAFLLLHPNRPHPREKLADLFWPDAPPGRGRRNLSDTLYRLKQALGEGWLEIERTKVGVPARPELWVDVWEFERLLALNKAEGVAPKTAAALQQAVELYLDELLPEIYDDWILAKRAHLHEQFLTALEALTAHFEAEPNLPQALLYARRLVATEPLREYNQQTYLRLLGRLQRHNEALAHYDRLQTLLQRELGIEPMPETQAIVTAIHQELSLPLSTPPPAERTTFAGRGPERATLLAAVDAALAGQGSFVAVEGPAGIGKSRLLREATRSIEWRGATVLLGHATHQPVASPYHPLAEALAELLAGPLAAQIEALLPAPTLARLAPLYAPWQQQAELPEVPPAQARQLFHQALVDLFQTLAGLKPCVLILDDLHWADPALWTALAALLPSLPHHRLLLLLAYRRPEIERSAGWPALREWEQTGSMTVIPLGPLSEAEVRQLLPAEWQAEAEQVVASSGGNPFYITELVDTLAEGGDPHGNTVLARLKRLPPTARQALEAAAILGREIPYRVWAELADLPVYELAEAGEQLQAGHFLERNQTDFTFSHDLIQTAVYQQLKPAQRRQLHRRAAASLARFDPHNLRGRAFHLDQAQEKTEAAALYRRVGEQALVLFAFVEAQQAFERALALSPVAPTIERVETLMALGRVCDVTGDRTRQQVVLTEALHAARHLAETRLETEALLGLGQAAAQTGEVGAAAGHLQQALTLAQAQNDPHKTSEATFLLGDLAARRGQFDEARAHFEAARQQAQVSGHRQREAHALRGLAIVARQTGQIETALAWFEQALAVYRQIGDRFAASVIQANLLGGYYFLGAWDRLLGLAGEALAVKEALGDRLGAAIVRQTQGLAVYALGDYEGARPLLAQALAECEAIGEQRTAGLTRNVLGLVAEGEGRLAEARDHYEAALGIATEIEASTEAAYAQHDLGALCLHLGEVEAAVALLEAAQSTWAEHNNELLQLKSEVYLGLARLARGERAQAESLAQTSWQALQKGIPSGEQPQAWLWTLHQLLAALEHPAEANEALHAAYRELQRQATAIHDPAMRRSFFERVPLSQKIVAAYDRLTEASRQITVTLAHCEAPLGRPLIAEEMITVQWHVHAPEDEAILDKAARRRHRLQRLLQEAQAQNAVPTDEDLAQALGVSRRTILRDMAVLAESGLAIPTRRRK